MAVGAAAVDDKEGACPGHYVNNLHTATRTTITSTMSKKVRLSYTNSDYGTVEVTRNGGKAKLKRRRTGKTGKAVEESRRNGNK